MRQLIGKYITGRRIIFLFLLTNLVYATMLLITIPGVMAYAGGLKLFDMMPGGYSLEYAEKLLATLGQQGRDAYLYNQIPLDMLYPLLSSLTYSLMLSYLLIKLELFEKSWFYLSLLPVFGGLFDYSENMGIITMLTAFPRFTSATVQITSMISVMKSGLYALSFTIIILLSIFLVISKLRRGKHKFPVFI